MHQSTEATATPDVTVVVRVRDDEERVGHAAGRIGRYLRGLGLAFELLVADESSGDNSVAVATLLKRELPELAVIHAPVGRGYYVAAQQARGRALLLVDARTEVPLARVAPSLAQLKNGHDVVVVDDHFIVLRRTKTWRTFAALVTTQRRPRTIERRILRRAHRLSLAWLGRPRGLGWRARWKQCVAFVTRPLRLLARPRRLALP